MLHHEASPEKPKYDMATPPPPPPPHTHTHTHISRQPLPLFLLKVFIPTPLPPDIYEGEGGGLFDKTTEE